MTRNETFHAETERDHLAPDHPVSTSGDLVLFARQTRTQMLREFGRWLEKQASGAVKTWAKRCQTWRSRRHAAVELQRLDDRLLRDLGINRSEIQSVVSEWDATRIPRGEIRIKPARAAVAERTRPAETAIRKNAA